MVRLEPLKKTVEPDVKFVPLTVMVNVESPTVFEVGEIEVVVGAGLLTVKVCAFEVPPPGAGLETVMLNVPAPVKSDDGIEAVNCVELTKVVVRAPTAKLTTEVDTKLVPLTVIVKVLSPTIFDVGEIEVVVGAGLLRVNVLDAPVSVPPVLVAVIVLRVPAPVKVTD